MVTLLPIANQPQKEKRKIQWEKRPQWNKIGGKIWIQKKRIIKCVRISQSYNRIALLLEYKCWAIAAVCENEEINLLMIVSSFAWFPSIVQQIFAHNIDWNTTTDWQYFIFRSAMDAWWKKFFQSQQKLPMQRNFFGCYTISQLVMLHM